MNGYNEIICNATPLIAFSRINQLSLMQKIVNTILITKSVAAEISEYSSASYDTITLLNEHWIKVVSVKSENQVKSLLPSLDRGEAEVIALALERQARLVLIDELTGRKVAESLGLKISGSVGILIKAKELGEVQEIKPLLIAMKSRGIYFSDRFINKVLEQVGES